VLSNAYIRQRYCQISLESLERMWVSQYIVKLRARRCRTRSDSDWHQYGNSRHQPHQSLQTCSCQWRITNNIKETPSHHAVIVHAFVHGMYPVMSATPLRNGWSVGIPRFICSITQLLPLSSSGMCCSLSRYPTNIAMAINDCIITRQKFLKNLTKATLLWLPLSNHQTWKCALQTVA